MSELCRLVRICGELALIYGSEEAKYHVKIMYPGRSQIVVGGPGGTVESLGFVGPPARPDIGKA